MKPGQKLAINWPLAWYRSHNTTKRLLDEGRIGDLVEVHYYDGNRGPLYHVADKVDGERRGRREAKARELVLQEGRGRRQPDRLSRLWHDAGHLVPQRRRADRGDRGGRRDAGHRGRPAFDDGRPLHAGAQQVRDAVGDDLRSLDAAADPASAASSSSAPRARSRAGTTTTRCTLQLRGGQPEIVPVDEPKPGRRGVDRLHGRAHPQATCRSRVRCRPRWRWSASASSTPPSPPSKAKRTLALLP